MGVMNSNIDAGYGNIEVKEQCNASSASFVIGGTVSNKYPGWLYLSLSELSRFKCQDLRFISEYGSFISYGKPIIFF